MEYAMAFLVRADLGMSKGKGAVQVAHGAIYAYKRARAEDIALWESEESQSKKLALRVDNVEELLALRARAEDAHLNTALVVDAGLTQIPAGSITVCAIGPAPVDALKRITGHLKLW